MTAPMLYSPFVERAMRFAAVAHQAQTRKGSDLPYLTHLASVALILTRAGFDDDEALSAALLHDAVEDAGITGEAIAAAFSPRVAELVAAVSEVKRDATGAVRPWRARKEDYVRHLRAASVEAKAISLADKLHNLGTLAYDLATDPAAWGRFNAAPDEQFWYYGAVLEAAGDDPRVARLASECRTALDTVKALAPGVGAPAEPGG